MLRSKIQPVATVLEHRELYDRPANLNELISFIRDLDVADCARLLCQMNADFRLVKPGRDSRAKLQQEFAGGLLSDETIRRAKERFGNENMADRPVFYPAQTLNVFRLIAANSTGGRSPLTDDNARHALGDPCLMMTDLMMTSEERKAVKFGDPKSVSRSLMVQMSGPFEIQNPPSIAHVAYRARILFHELLQSPRVLSRISRYRGFNFEQQFLRVTGVSLSSWLNLMLSFYAYLAHYLDQQTGERRPEFLAIDRIEFKRNTPIPQEDLDTVLKSVSTNLGEFKVALRANGAGDWRFDSVPFRNAPFIELSPGKFHCFDLGLLVEKIHSGVYWIIHEGLTRDERPDLSGAWGIPFEEYVNWFLVQRQFRDFVFWGFPKWCDGDECLDGAFMKNSVLMPIEYKGGFLLRGARYSGKEEVFEKELDRKMGDGCRQLARKIEMMFNRRAEKRKTLQEIPLNHITRVVPLLVVQDPILGAPLINWRLNRIFNESLNRTLLRVDIKVDGLNVIGIRDLESMAESAEAGTFDLFGSVQHRCYADPEMRNNLHNFLLECPGYGEAKSPRIRGIIDEQFRVMTQYLFGRHQQVMQ